MDKLEDLYEEKTALLGEIKQLKLKQAPISTRINELQDKVNKLNVMIEGLTKVNIGSLKVSDHALVRYLERSYNLDIQSIREDIIKSIAINRFNIIDCNNVKIPIEKGLRAVIKDNNVISIVPST